MADKANMYHWENGDDLNEYMKSEGLVAEYDAIYKTAGNQNRTFIGIDTNLSLRSEYNRVDYDRRRPSERNPQGVKGQIALSMRAYEKVGIVRNVIDMMADFGGQGIRLVHPNKKIEKFYERWFKKVSGKERSERFLNYFYRTANVVVRRIDAKIDVKTENDWKKSQGKNSFRQDKVKSRTIPIKYIFHNPLAVEPMHGEELASFIGKPMLTLRISRTLSSRITSLVNNRKNQNLDKLFQDVPPEIRAALKKGANFIPLNPKDISVYYYKRDDWLLWARPMISAVLEDLMILEKLKLADVSALDGAISSIRLWKLGSLEHKIIPTRAAINKLRNILANNVGGGTIDLVWGPEISFEESKTSVHQFLGSEKYKPHWNAIYDGLGIPSSLTSGDSGGSSGFTNNFLSLKTLIERLEYGRDTLITFWEQEIKRVQEAMGFRFPAQIVFDQMVLSDEAAEKALLIQLIDRDIVSAETVLERFDILTDMEKTRIKREVKERGEKMPDKAGPFHNPQTDEDLRKLFVQGGGVTPSEVGIELLPKKDGETSMMEMKQAQDAKFKPVGNPNDGRPRNSKDKNKRKSKRVLPRSSAEEFFPLFQWAYSLQSQISEIVNPALLHAYNKENLRKLTSSEQEECEHIKFSILCAFQPFEDITEEKVYDILRDKDKTSVDIVAMAKTLAYIFMNKHDRQPNLDERRQIQASAYSLSHTEEDDV